MAKKRNEEEIVATVSELPLEPPVYAVELLQKRGMLLKERLIYSCTYQPDPLTKKKRKMVKLYCTHCKETSYAEHVSLKSGCSRGGSLYTFGFLDFADHETKVHGNTCICPACGKGMEALHISHICNSYEMDRAFCVSAHNVRGHLCLLSWTIGKYVNKNGEVFYNRQRWEGDLIVDGHFVRVTGCQRFMSSVSFYPNWEMRTKGIDGIGSRSRSEILNFTKDDVESTDSAYCALYEYIRDSIGQDRYPGAYLQLWCKYPHVENLIRQGYTKFVNAVIAKSIQFQGSYYSARVFYVSRTNEYVNWKRKKPLEMLGLDKSEAYIAKNYNLELVGLYKKIRDQKEIRLDDDCLNYIESCCGVWSFVRLIQNDFKIYDYDIPIVRVLHYLIKQMKILPKNEAEKISPSFLADYWGFVHRIYGSMQRSELYPKNLVHAHDHFVKQIEWKEEQELKQKFIERSIELSLMSYESPSLNLLIRPCATQAEMIQEGKILSHCVGGYANDHANGKTAIFFIRRMDQPDTPYFTLEYALGKIRQDRGYKNCNKTEDIVAFEKEWLLHVEKILKQKGKTNGKSITNSEQLRAGA